MLFRSASRSGRTAFTWTVSRGGWGGATTGLAVKSNGMPSTSVYSTLNSPLFGPSSFSSYDWPFVLLGRSGRRRLLVVMFTERGEAIRLISARRATPRERRGHEEGES